MQKEDASQSPESDGQRHRIHKDNLQQDLDAKTAIWQASICREALITLLKLKQPPGGWKFTKIVCLGTDSFGRVVERIRGASMFQLACVIDVAGQLPERGLADAGTTVEIFAQEPDYTEEVSLSSVLKA